MPAAKRRIDDAERRARLGTRHHLDSPTHDVVAVAGSLVGLHSTDPATVFLSARARVAGFEPPTLEKALYEDRTLVRMLGMRRTMFVVPTELAPCVHGATTRALIPAQRKRVIGWIEEAGLAKDGARWLGRAENATLKALEELGEATAVELSKMVPALAKKIVVGAGTKWETTIGMSTRVLFLLATEGRIVRTRPKGSWISTQYRWALFERWADLDIDASPDADAQAELARQWLASFGPATAEDLKWWTGWSLGTARKALAALEAVEVELDCGSGFVLPDDLDPVRPGKSWIAFLPALDPTIMGWKERDWYLGSLRDALFDRSGNAGPTIWSDGRVIGGWAQRPDGRVVTRLLTGDVSSKVEKAVQRQAESLEEWLGEVRVIPRFRTPLERELSAG